MSTDDLTLEILTEIRTEVRATNTRLDATNMRLDATDTRLDRIETGLGTLRADLTRELGAFEMRQATRVNEQTAATRGLYAKVIGQFELRDRVELCEHDIAAIRDRVGMTDG